jgi:beta-glucuronidase
LEAILDDHLEGFHEKYNMPIILTEFGADAIAGMHALPVEMWSEEYQKITVEKILYVLRGKKYIIGEQIWNFADFKTGQHTGRPILNYKGVFTRNRQPKLVAHFLKDVWGKTN